MLGVILFEWHHQMTVKWISIPVFDWPRKPQTSGFLVGGSENHQHPLTDAPGGKDPGSILGGNGLGLLLSVVKKICLAAILKSALCSVYIVMAFWHDCVSIH